MPGDRRRIVDGGNEQSAERFANAMVPAAIDGNLARPRLPFT